MQSGIRNRTAVLWVCALGLATLGGCTGSRTYVLDSVKERRSHASVSIRQVASTVGTAEGAGGRFEATLAEKLRPEGQISEYGGDLVIEYRFVLFDAGSTAARVGAGVASLAGSPFYGIGDGAVGVEVSFRDGAGSPLGRIVVDGPVAGLFGSTNGALDAAAGSIAKFAKANYLGAAGSGAGGEGRSLAARE